MKKLLIALICLFTAVSAFSAPKPRKVGHDMELYAYRFDNAFFVIVHFDDDSKRCNGHPILKMKLADGQVLKLDGASAIGKTTTSTVGGMSNGVGFVSGISSDEFFVVLPISEEDINKLGVGVTKVAFNTLPSPYIKTIDDESLGANLIKDFYSLKDEFDE